MKKIKLSPRLLVKLLFIVRETVEDVNAALDADSDGGARVTTDEAVVLGFSLAERIANAILEDQAA